MSRAKRVRRLLRLPAAAAETPRVVAEEIAFHIESRTQALQAAGMTEGEARAQAEREFGNVAEAQAELSALELRRVRRERRAAWYDAAGQDLRSAWRSVRKDPRFAIPVVLTLALALGANAAMFGIADHLLLRPPPQVRDPQQVVHIYHQLALPQRAEPVVVIGYSYFDYAALREGVTKLDNVAAYTTAGASIGRGETARHASMLVATANFFPLLGVQPLRGRFYTEAEDSPGRAEHVAVLAYGYWRRAYGGSGSVLGQSIDIGRERYRIIGVAPRGFRGLELQPVDLIVPVSAYAQTERGPDWYQTRGWSWLSIVARLRDPADAAAAMAQATTVRRNVDRSYGDNALNHAMLVSIDPLKVPEILRGGAEDQTSTTSLVLLAVAIIVLLIACANVANLLLAKALRRSRELGIRVALGVSRRRLLTLVMTEALLLCVAGSVLGLGLAGWIGRSVRVLMLPDVDWSGATVDGHVLLFMGGLLALCTILVGVVPAWQIQRADLHAILKAGAYEGDVRRHVLRRALVVAQATLSVMLLVGAGLFVRSLRNVRAVDLGFDADHVLVLTWDRRALDRSPQEWSNLYEQAAAQVQQLPGVVSTSVAATIPFLSSTSVTLWLPGRDSALALPGGPYVTQVDTGYFRTMGTRIVEGRSFTAADRTGTTPVAIVDEAFAGVAWPGQSALGKCFRNAPDGVCFEVVGVARNAMRLSVSSAPEPQFFRPLSQDASDMRALFIRTVAGSDAAIDNVRTIVQRIDPQLPYAGIRSMAQVVEPMVRPWRLGATLFLAFGALALVVAALGLYSVMAYNVTARRHEMGVRMALGARAPELLRLVLRDASRMLALGVLLGLAGAAMGTLTIRQLLFRVSPRDPLVYAAVATLLPGIGMIAALLPARRAARVDPCIVLRAE